jgi:T5SS/PEP-CTERM-associated repeat protein
MKTQIQLPLLSALILVVTVSSLRAQLVADGATAFINATSVNLAGDLTIGTNGSFTTLIITNSGAVTNTGGGAIGLNAAAKTNRVIVTGANSTWDIANNLAVGSAGSFNELIMTNGGKVFGSFGNIGHLSTSAYNTATVTGNGSIWTLTNVLNVGNAGRSNRLVVANAAKAVSGGGYVGFGSSSIGNVAVITGAGSQWSNDSGLPVGGDSSFNQMVISNGAAVLSDGAYVGGKFTQSGAGSSNSVIITGAGSSWTNTSTSSVGNFGKFNQLIITNGGVMRNTAPFASLVLGWQPFGSNNTVIVTGTNSLFSNRGLNGARLTIGQGSSFNQLFLRDGGVAQTDVGELAENSSSSNNVAVVADAGSLWFSTFDLFVGNAGPGNQLTVSTGGTASAADFYLGFADTSSNNTAIVTGGSIIVSNAAGTSIADIRRGTLTLNSGIVRADILLLTNGPQSQFDFNGGTLQTRTTTVNNGSAFTVGNGSDAAILNVISNGLHTFNDGLTIAGNASLQGNGVIRGVVTVASGGKLIPGASVGKMVLSNSPSLQGTIILEVSKNGATRTNNQIQVTAPLTYGGALIVTNLGPTPLGTGDRFQLFSAATYAGSFAPLILPPLNSGIGWSNKLLLDGSIEVIVAPQPKFSGITVSGTNVILTGTNGLAGANYTVLTATDITVPLGNWVGIVTNQFGSGGEFSFTNGIAAGEPQRYFAIRTP